MSHSQSFSFRFAEVDSLRHVCRHKYPCHALPISGDRSWCGKTFRRSQISPEIYCADLFNSPIRFYLSQMTPKNEQVLIPSLFHYLFDTSSRWCVHLLSMGLPCLVNSRNVTAAPWRMRSKFPPSWYYPRLCVFSRLKVLREFQKT
jgi:hypothetical protein